MRKLLCILTLALSIVALSQGAAAESHEDPQPGLLIVHYDNIDPARVAEYEANNRDWVAAFTEAEMGPEHGWQGYSGPDFTYAWVSPAPNYAYLDGWQERQKAMREAVGEEKMEMLEQPSGVVTHYTEILREDPELSYFPEGFEFPNGGVAHLGVHYVRPGMGEAFRELVGEVVAAYKQVESPTAFAAHWVAFGRGSYAFVTFAESLGAFYSGPGTGAVLAEAYGPEKAQEMFAKWGECITHYEQSDWRMRPDLSYPAPAAESDEGE